MLPWEGPPAEEPKYPPGTFRGSYFNFYYSFLKWNIFLNPSQTVFWFQYFSGMTIVPNVSALLQELPPSSKSDDNVEEPFKSCSDDHLAETNTLHHWFLSILLQSHFLNVFFTDLRPCGFIIFVIQQISLSSFNFYATNSSTELAVLKSQQIILAKKVSFREFQFTFCFVRLQFKVLFFSHSGYYCSKFFERSFQRSIQRHRTTSFSTTNRTVTTICKEEN